MIDRIYFAGCGILLIGPLAISFLYLIKIIMDSKRTDSKSKFGMKLLFSFFFTVLIFFLIYFIIARLIFRIAEIPTFSNVLGIVLFFLYYFTFGGFLYGLGMLGHGGVSPKKIIYELFNTYFKKSDPKL